MPQSMAGSMLARLLAQRDRLLASPAFHRGVLRFLPARLIARRRARQLFDIAAGFTYSQILAACIQLNLFERLRSGPVDLQTLCREHELEPEALLRLLRGAAGLGLLQPAGEDQWRLGELGAASLGSPGIAAMVRHHHMLYSDLCDPVALLRDRSQSRLGDYWAYAAKPGFSESGTAVSYSELMAQSQSFVADDVLANCSLRGRRRLLDVGGGSGVFAAEALQRFQQN